VPNSIEVRGVEKTFHKKRPLKDLVTRPFGAAEEVRALRGVDLEVEPGEIFGLLGPNGAGKTTLLKILSCLVLPDRGEVRVGGFDIADENRVKPLLGLVHSDERSFYWRLTGRQNLEFFATLYDVPRGRRGARIAELLERVDLVTAADRPFSDYSSGMKQRMAIARALLHDPPILLMDEPTRSLDPASAMALRGFIAEQLSGRDRKTIVLATHNLREAEELCGRVAILAGGRIREIGRTDAVRRFGLDDRRYELVVDRWPAGVSGPFRVMSDEPVDSGRRIEVQLDAGGGLGDVLRGALGAGVTIRRCAPVDSDLEDAFARILSAERAAGVDA